MDRVQLLQRFETLAETPVAIPKLRMLVLDLAAQGRLGSCAEAKSHQQQNLGAVIDLISGQHLRPDDYNEEGDGIPYLTGSADFGSRFPKASRWTRTLRR